MRHQRSARRHIVPLWEEPPASYNPLPFSLELIPSALPQAAKNRPLLAAFDVLKTHALYAILLLY